MAISQIYNAAPGDERDAAETRVYQTLQKLQIPFTRVDHDAAQTMEDCAAIGEVLGVEICKNLVLTPRNKSAFYLFCMPGNQPFSTKDFSKQIGSSRLSFASPEDMEELLGVQPGSASILALINDPQHRVQLCVARSVWEAEWFGCHPCRNTSSVKLKTADVRNVFLPYTGHEAIIVEG